MITKFLKDSKGATAIEYALIASLISVVAITGMKSVGNSIQTRLNAISSTINSVETPTLNKTQG